MESYVERIKSSPEYRIAMQLNAARQSMTEMTPKLDLPELVKSDLVRTLNRFFRDQANKLLDSGGDSPSMTLLATQCGSDRAEKGYTEIYGSRFSDMRKDAKAILEIGASAPQNANIELWKQYFPTARVHCAYPSAPASLCKSDTVEAELFAMDARVTLHKLDKLNRDDVKRFYASMAPGFFNVIVDRHTADAPLSDHMVLGSLFHLVRPGGEFIVENAERCLRLQMTLQQWNETDKWESDDWTPAQLAFLTAEVAYANMYTTERGSKCAVFRRRRSDEVIVRL